MPPLIYFLIFISYSVNVYLIYHLFQTERSRTAKLLYFVILLAPVAGPFIYFFLAINPQPSRTWLRNDMPRGHYTQFWISLNKELQDPKRQESPKPESSAVPGTEP